MISSDHGSSGLAGPSIETDVQPTTLQFSLESIVSGQDKRGDGELDGLSEVPVSELRQRISGACQLSIPERKLAAAVAAAKEDCLRRLGTIELWLVAAELRSKHGYLVRIRRAMGAKQPKAYLHALRHTFMVVSGLEGQEGTDVIIDLSFRDHFALPHAQPWYAQLLAALPPDWLGPLPSLTMVASIMATAMRLAFKVRRTPLPPWREPRAVLSKWLPEWYEDEAAPLLPRVDVGMARMLAPYHGAPFRAAVTAIRAMPMGRGACTGGGSAPTLLQPGQLQAPPAVPPAAAPSGMRSLRSATSAPDVPRKIITGFRSRDQGGAAAAAAACGLASVAGGGPAASAADASSAYARRAAAAAAVGAAALLSAPRGSKLPSPGNAAAAGPAAGYATSRSDGAESKVPLPSKEVAVQQPQPATCAPSVQARSAGLATAAVTAVAAAAPEQMVLRAGLKSLDVLLPPMRIVKLGAK